MCKVLKISKSGYYNWLHSGMSKRWLYDQELGDLIEQILEESLGSYGSPRIKKELIQRGYTVSRPKIARMMKTRYLVARKPRKFKFITDSNHHYPIAPNLLNQDFTVQRKNEVWVSDITYISTKQGWMYLTVIIDLYNRKVVGWSMSRNLSTQDTIIKAWNMAIGQNTITQKLIFHSDRGSQYASYEFTKLIRAYHGLIKQSMSRKGNCWDNAVAESFFKSLKVEWVYKHDYQKITHAELSIFRWIETWYNKKRRHSALALKSIDEFELDNRDCKQVA